MKQSKTRRRVAAVWMVACGLCLTACAEDSGSGSTGDAQNGQTAGCTPGASTACSCIDGASGTQTCLDGTSLSQCVCSGGAGACTPNATQACACPGGMMGVQTCDATGQALSACACMDGMAGQFAADDGSGGMGGDQPVIDGPPCPGDTVCGMLSGNPQPACLSGSLPPACPDPGEDTGVLPGANGGHGHGEGGCDTMLGFDEDYGDCISYPDFGLGPMCWQLCTLSD